MLVSDMQVHPQSFYDLVNIIRGHEDIFPAWHASDTAKLYSPAIFVNQKEIIRLLVLSGWFILEKQKGANLQQS